MLFQYFSKTTMHFQNLLNPIVSYYGSSGIDKKGREIFSSQNSLLHASSVSSCSCSIPLWPCWPQYVIVILECNIVVVPSTKAIMKAASSALHCPTIQSKSSAIQVGKSKRIGLLFNIFFKDDSGKVKCPYLLIIYADWKSQGFLLEKNKH